MDFYFVISIEYSIYLGFVKCKTRAVISQNEERRSEADEHVSLWSTWVTRSLRLKEMNINFESKIGSWLFYLFSLYLSFSSFYFIQFKFIQFILFTVFIQSLFIQFILFSLRIKRNWKTEDCTTKRLVRLFYFRAVFLRRYEFNRYVSSIKMWFDLISYFILFRTYGFLTKTIIIKIYRYKYRFIEL